MKKLLLAALIAGTAFSSSAILYEYDKLNEDNRTCRLASWSGQQPASGKLVLKDTYEKDGVTYRITAIAPGALNNLTSVTEITIGANTTTIGDNSLNRPYDDVMNFNNCPRLVKFHVAEGNIQYVATGAGLLVRTDEVNILARVPQAVVTNNGTLKLGESIIQAAQNAFGSNTTISTLVLPSKFDFMFVPGIFTNMRALKAIDASANPYLYSEDGILYTTDRTGLICYPPLREGINFTVPSSVTTIEKNAFQGVQKLNSVELSNVTDIRKNAFAKCAISKLTIPGTVKTIGRGAFRECPYLASVAFQGQHTLEESAFKGCHALTTANLSVKIKLSGDSIFESCGFKKIDYPAGNVPEDFKIPAYTFANCRNIETFDLTSLTASEKNALLLGANITKGCTKLASAKLPAHTSFGGSGAPESCTFGVNSPLKEVVLSTFYSVGNPCLFYTEGNNLPRIYLQATGAEECAWNFQDFFKTSGQGSVRPLIFTDAYKLTYKDHDIVTYCYPTANYYVPALARKNYTKAIEQGLSVSEMFELSVDKSTGKVKIINRYPNDIVFGNISVDGGTPVKLGDDKTADLGTQLATGTTMRIEYKFRDVRFKTDYPLEDFTSSSVDTIADNTAANHEVYTLSGTLVASGEGNADLSTMPAGVYVLRTFSTDGNISVRKIIVR